MIAIHCDELENSNRLVKSVLPLQVIDVTCSFFIANTEISINLRNFSDQIVCFTTLCDNIPRLGLLQKLFQKLNNKICFRCDNNNWMSWKNLQVNKQSFMQTRLN
jgi:hypothetical protein